MSKEQVANSLIKVVKDKELVDFFYLEYALPDLMKFLKQISFTMVKDNSDVPFYAQIRGYTGAVDNNKQFWIVKKIEEGGIVESILNELTYYLDFRMQTLTAPTIFACIDGGYYRATKVVKNATQIGGFDYLQEPVRRVLACDLINRWLFFDEDRNPNNYMIIHNSRNLPLVVAIDYNHTDLETTEMKITGMENEFGWHRTEKTRFLTLLKPSNFDTYTLADFEDRLNSMNSLDEKELKEICMLLFSTFVKEPAKLTALVTANLLSRKKYIYDYFVKSFKDRKSLGNSTNESDYSGMGKQFIEIYKNKI